MPAPGTAFLPELSPRAVWGLADSMAWLDDHWLMDVRRVLDSDERAVDPHELHMADYLPCGVVAVLDARMARNFYLCLSVASWKLTQVHAYYPACVGEELSLHAIITQAKTSIEFWDESDPSRLPDEDPAYDAELDDLYDTAFEDTDFLEMYDPARDGIDTSPIGRELAFTSLAVADLFKKFDGSCTTAHPWIDSDSQRWPRAHD